MHLTQQTLLEKDSQDEAVGSDINHLRAANPGKQIIHPMRSHLNVIPFKNNESNITFQPQTRNDKFKNPLKEDK